MWFLLLNFLAVFSLVASDHHIDIDCGQPVEIDHAHIEYLTKRGETTLGTVFRYVCHEPLWALSDHDHGVYICTKMGKWLNRHLKEALPHCQKVANCGEPKAIEHGHVEHLTDHLENDYLSVIKYTCNADYRESEYSDEGIYVCGEKGQWVNKDLGHKIPTCIPVLCGEAMTHIDSEKDTSHTELVTHGAAPWSVLLQRGNDTSDLRNAVLIDHRWALTSSHNFHSHNEKAAAAEFTAHVGVEDAQDLSTGHSYHVERVVFEPGLPAPSEEYRHDIALLKLAEPVVYGDHAIPICLPHVDYAVAGQHGVVAGWDLDHEGGAHHLTYATLPIVLKVECALHFADNHPGLFPADLAEQFCTHALEHRPDAAQRDKGAVFQAELNGTTYAVGVLAFDDPGEGHERAVFTDVYDHVTWIKSVINPH